MHWAEQTRLMGLCWELKPSVHQKTFNGNFTIQMKHVMWLCSESLKYLYMDLNVLQGKYGTTYVHHGWVSADTGPRSCFLRIMGWGHCHESESRGL
jgi:hypothetical protein